jgi:hypothetical protein
MLVAENLIVIFVFITADTQISGRYKKNMQGKL